MEIKRWAVVSKDSSNGYKRGEVPWSVSSKEAAEEELKKWFNSDDFEIVELTGTLPERKVKCQ